MFLYFSIIFFIFSFIVIKLCSKYNILIDDKSTDDSLKITNNFKHNKNFRIIKNKKNIGLVKSCNKAIKYLKTDFFVRVDSDDYVSKDFVKYILLNIKNGYDFIFTNYKILEKNKIKKINIKDFKLKYLISCSVVLRTKITKNIGGYRNYLWEEYDLYLRYFKKTKKIFKINKYLYYYRLHGKNMTKLVSWKKKAWAQIFKNYKKSEIKNLEKKFKLK